MDYFFDLESSQDMFVQDSALDRSVWQTKFILRVTEDLCPQGSFLGVFKLWQVEIGTRATFVQKSATIVEDEQAEVEERTADRLLVNDDMFLG